MDYFSRKEEMKRLAIEHNQLTCKLEDVLRAVTHTYLYSIDESNDNIMFDYFGYGDVNFTGKTVCGNLDKIYSSVISNVHFPANCEIWNNTTMEAVDMCMNEECKVGILNFASYKNPGGMFLEGSSAQEESICHETNLYHVLSNDFVMQKFYLPNRKQLNKALYTSKVLYTPHIKLYLHNGHHKDKEIDVITCAAPNYKAFRRYHRVTEQDLLENNIEVRKRIQLILEVAKIHNVQILILGAFGCGVFGQDPLMVATEFATAINCNNPFKKIIFAVPGNDRNYIAFKEMFNL